MKNIALLFLCCLMAFSLAGQERTYREYATQEVDRRLKENHLQFEENKRLIEEHVKGSLGRDLPADPVKIPLVFHIVQNEQTKNTTLSQVRAQVEVLNRSFAGRADSGISFELAGTGKDRERKDAVFHYPSGRKKWGTDDAVKQTVHGGADALFPRKCLNIWVCDLGR